MPTTEQLKERTKRFAVRIIHLFQELPESKQMEIIGVHLLRSGTSVGAKYARVRHARSNTDLIIKLGRVIKEAEESAYWLELLVDLPTANPEAQALLKEARQLVAIFNAAQNKARKKSGKKRS